MLLKKLNFNHPLVMGVLNTTPDSFSDGGNFVEKQMIESRIATMLQEGVNILDIGGESSAPGSSKISAETEITRILPALEYCQNKDVFVSVDTYKSSVANRAIKLGAQMINDVTALRGDPKLTDVIAKSGVYLVLMYSKDHSARTTRQIKTYQNVTTEIKTFFSERLEFALRRGIKKEQIILDPGMGAFVSSAPEPSLKIIQNLSEFQSFGLPILIGASRKSFIGQILNVAITDRLEGSLAAATLAVYNGANIIRAHDVLATKRVIQLSDAIRNI